MSENVQSEIRTRCEHDNPQNNHINQVQFEVRTRRKHRNKRITVL